MPNTSNVMKWKIKIFLMRSLEVMRAGTGNKNFFICPKEGAENDQCIIVNIMVYPDYENKCP